MSLLGERFKQFAPGVLRYAAMGALTLSAFFTGASAMEDHEQQAFASGFEQATEAFTSETPATVTEYAKHIEPLRQSRNIKIGLFTGSIIATSAIFMWEVSSSSRLYRSERLDAKEKYVDSMANLVNEYHSTYTEELRAVTTRGNDAIEDLASGDITPDEARIIARELEIRSSNFELKPIDK